MKPRRTHLSNKVFRLDGGTEDNDLWATSYSEVDGGPAIGSTWVPTDEERAQIAGGLNLELIVFGSQQPPVALRVVDYAIGRAPEASDV